MNDTQAMKLLAFTKCFFVLCLQISTFFANLCFDRNADRVMLILKKLCWPANNTEMFFCVNRTTHLTTGCNIWSML